MRQIRATGGLAVAGSLLVSLLAGPPVRPLSAQSARDTDDAGLVVTDDAVIGQCADCHEQDESGRLSRISFVRKTPEGWQTSIRRMVMLNDVDLDPATARAIVRYLSNHHGLAPEEARPAMFEAERRMIDYRYEADEETETTCKQCHSLGRVISQRRTEEEWGLLLATHRGLYPDADFQAFRRGGPAEPGEDARHPMDKAIAHLSDVFPLDTPEWNAWSATMRSPRLTGTWSVEGHAPGRGPIYGQVTIAPAGRDGDFTTETRLHYAIDGRNESRSGRATVYTGFQWRGRSSEGGDRGQLREVMFVERHWRSMSGRWYTGDYDEIGLDITLHRVGADPVIAGVYPRAVRIGTRGVRLTVYGANLPTNPATDEIDLGPGIRIDRIVGAAPDAMNLEVTVTAAAARGARDVFVGAATKSAALVAYERVDRITVTPRAGMARVGGVAFPKQFQQFEAVGYDDGPDDDDDADDLRLGLVPVSWSIDEYSATYDDDDVDFVGAIDEGGLFTPAVDGPNPNRSRNRNNIGDVWVVATHVSPDGDPIRARAHLLVTVPLYIRWDPWTGER